MAMASLFKSDKLSADKLDRRGNYEDVDDGLVSVQAMLQSKFEPTIMKFPMPPGCDPKKFVQQHFGEGSKMQFAKGTTTLSFVYEGAGPQDKGGVIVCVDSRASSGLYVSSKTVMKVLPVTKHIVATMAGGAADCQFWISWLAKQCSLYELRMKDQITVAAASKILQNMLYQYRNMGLSVGTMVCGFDKRGASIYYVDNDGNRVKGEKFAVGSGQTHAYGILETYYKARMTDAEAMALGRKAIMHATFRDSGSGGGSNLFHITADEGVKQYERVDVSDMTYEFLNKQGFELHKPGNL